MNHEFYMQRAEYASEDATCDRLHVGCVLVKNAEIIGIGCNSSILGHDNCNEVGHLMFEGGCKRTVHAEINAIVDCALHSAQTMEGSTVYVTHYPCPECMRTMNQAGIKEVYYKHYYKHRYDNEFDIGMKIIPFEELLNSKIDL